MKLLSQIIVFFISVVSFAQGFSQEELDKLDYEELLELFNKVEFDSTKAELVARAYLERARLESDTIKMARGYDRLARIFHPEKNIAFADSVIALTENKNHISYPAIGFMLKSFEYARINNLPESNKNLYYLYDYALDNGNVAHKLYALNELIEEKTKWGDKKSSLEIQHYRHSLIMSPTIKDDIKRASRNGYYDKIDEFVIQNKILSFLTYSKCYTSIGQFSNSYVSLNRAENILENYKGQFLDYLNNAVRVNRIELLHRQNRFEDVLQEANEMKQMINDSMDYFSFEYNHFAGLAHINLDSRKEGVTHLLRADSIYSTGGIRLAPNHRKIFEELLAYYKQINDVDNQLRIYNKLSFVDSLYTENYRFFEPQMIRKFETPRLIAEKEEQIQNLKSKNEKSMKLIWWILVILIIVIVWLVYYIIKQRKFRKRFNDLISFQQSKPLQTKSIAQNKLSSSIIEEILNQLDNFEENRGYLKKDLSLRTLSKSFNTNSRYLSNVINLEKNKNFAQYINELRINHAISELMENKLLRKYTVKAIANEFGFKTSESFSKAFYKQFGIYPSYFLKNIEKNEMKGKKVTLKSILKKSPSVP